MRTLMTMCLLVLNSFTLPMISLNNQSNKCVPHSGNAPIIYKNLPDMGDSFNPQILNYLNITGNATGLQQKLEAAAGKVEQPLLNAQLIDADINNDGIQDVFVSLDIAWGATYQHLLSVFSCTGGQYNLLDSIQLGQFYDIGFAPGISIEVVADLNENHYPEIVIREGLVTQKVEQAISIYEWNTSKLVKTFTTGFQLGRYGTVSFQNVDNDLATLELALDTNYAYGQATATAAIELIRWRPIVMIYAWTANKWIKYCQHFTDTPTTLFETLQSAELYRSCGNFNEAEIFYRRMISEQTLERWTNPFSLKGGSTLASKTVAEMEENYLLSFASYRLIQLELNANNITGAAFLLKTMQISYQMGQQGFQHVAMATALLDNYKQTHDLNTACKAAKVAYDATRKVDDPGIPYYMNPGSDGRPDWAFGFYYDNGKIDSSDPDDIFNIPEDVADVLRIPVCLK